MSGHIKFYLDEHVDHEVAKGLRRRGVDVVTTTDVDMLGATDTEHLLRATADSRIVFTQDRDFLRLNASGISHAGIVYSPQHTDIGRIVQALYLIHQASRDDEMLNHVVFVY